MKMLLKKLKSFDEHTLEVVKKSINSLVIKSLGIAVLFITSVFLGRTLGPEGIGIINLADRIIIVLLIITLLGVPQLLIRDIAISYSKKEWRNVSNTLNSALLMNGIIASVIIAILILATPYACIHLFNEPGLITPLIILLVALLTQIYTRLIASSLIGFKKVWQSNLINETLGIFIIGFVLLIMYLLDFEINVVSVAWVYAISRFLVAVVAGIYWKKVFPSRVNQVNLIPYLLKSSLPFLMINATAIIASNTDTIMLGWLGDTRSVGIYTVTAKIALLTSFFLQVTNTAVSPKIAAMYNDNKIKEINLMVQKVTLGLIVLGLTSMIFFFIFGKAVLDLWGEGFTEGYMLLIILSVGQFFNIGTGSAGYVLIMCGHEKVQSRVAIFFMVLNIILNYFLIKNYGIVGAGIATAITVSLENVTKVILAKRKTNINTIPFDLIFKHGK